MIRLLECWLLIGLYQATPLFWQYAEQQINGEITAIASAHQVLA